MKNDIISRIKTRLSSIPRDKLIGCAVIAGICGMLLIAFGGEKPAKSTDKGTYSAEEYRICEEKRLTELLTRIDGVGKAELMLTLEGERSYVYAQEYKTDSSEDSVRSENKIVIVDGNDSREALTENIRNPAVSGVVIVCEGGDDPKTCERIYRAVSTAMNVPTSRIYVAKLK